MKPSEAIDQAKAAYRLPKGEPLVGPDEVILRHLWDALERVAGINDMSAMAKISDALRGGQLTACTHKTRSIIPSATWPKPQSARNGPFSEDWLTGVIHTDAALPGFNGELPVVDRKEAERWLRTFQPKVSPGRPSVRGLAASAYHKIYPDGHLDKGHSWKEVAINVSRKLGENVAVDTIKRGLGVKK